MAENKTTLEPRWLWYAISFILPVVGILLGIIYRREEPPKSKEFGKRTTIAAIVGVVAYFTFYVVWLFVLGAAEWMK